jgi:hypothetical protein
MAQRLTGDADEAYSDVRLTARSPASSSPHRRLLLQVLGSARGRPTPWQEELRHVKAEFARAVGWVPADADDARALQTYKGLGRRTNLVRAVPVKPWNRSATVTFLVERCCRWIDYCRTRGIRSEIQLAGDGRTYGIERMPPSLAAVLNAIEPALKLDDAAYRQQRTRWGRVAFAKLRSPGCDDPDDFVRKLRRRSPQGRWPWRRIELSDEAAEMLQHRE